MLSPTDVCNLALAKLGARRINDIASDETAEAKSCRLHFPMIRDGLLRRHQWSFATARATLSRLAEDPPTEWSGAWQVPADLVRLVRIVGASPQNPVKAFALEGRRLLTRGSTEVSIVYISNAVPVGEWDSLFVDAVRLSLAAAIAGDVTQNPALAQNALRELEALALPAAQTADAREVLSGENMGPATVASMSALVNARLRANGRPIYPGGVGASAPMPPDGTPAAAPDLISIFESEL
jgi:hypothetical protein